MGIWQLKTKAMDEKTSQVRSSQLLGQGRMNMHTWKKMMSKLRKVRFSWMVVGNYCKMQDHFNMKSMKAIVHLHHHNIGTM
jgi:hypothetical protein